MPLQVSAFRGVIYEDPKAQTASVVDGYPLDVTVTAFTGTYTIPTGCNLVRLSGTGTVVWPGAPNAESISGVEWRGVNAGDAFVVA